MTLPLNQQVTSLELSQKLKELNVPQESLFYWGKLEYSDRGMVWELCEKGVELITKDMVSAFSVAELGELLPFYIDKNGAVLTLEITKVEDSIAKNWMIVYTTHYASRDENMYSKVFIDNEANCRAKMLIWLIENKHLDVTNLKKGE